MSLAAMCGTGAIALAFYVATLAPTVMWYDMGEFATASATLGIAHNTGYPLLILLGKLFTFIPAGETAWRVNLLSAVATAGAVALVYGIIHDLTGDIVASAAGALMLAFASTVWANATWATSYGLNLFFVALVTRQMLAWHRTRDANALIGAALAFGLALSNHRLIVLVAPPSLMLLALGWRSLRPRTCALACAAFALGLSVYAYLPIRGEQEPAMSWARPAEWRTYWSMFLNGQTPSGYWRFDVLSRIDVLWAYPSYDLTWAGLALAALGAGICVVQRRTAGAYFALMIALDAAVVLTYSIHNIYNYLTPGYLALCVFAGIAVAWVGGVIRERNGGAARPWLPALAFGVLVLLLPATLAARNFERVDRSNSYGAWDFAATTFDRLPPRAVLITDSWTAPPLWYAQLVEGKRHDVLVSPVLSSPGEDIAAFARDQIAAGRPVYAADGLRGAAAALDGAFALEPVLVGGIETMVTSELPKPMYRDDLVPRGSLYRVLEEPPQPGVAAVPAGAEREIAVAPGLTLAGFALDGDIVDAGSVVQLTYYWRAAEAQPNLSAVTLFAGEDGRVRDVHGWPAWWQTWDLGGATPAGEWRNGAIVRESYFTLVPRDTKPGVYEVQLSVFDGGAAPQAARAQAAGGLVTVGRITVR